MGLVNYTYNYLKDNNELNMKDPEYREGIEYLVKQIQEDLDKELLKNIDKKKSHKE